MSTGIERLSGTGGFIIVSTTGAQTVDTVESIYVMTDAVFTVFKINDVDMMTTKGLTGVTIKAGTWLPSDATFKITAFTLASGTVVKYY